MTNITSEEIYIQNEEVAYNRPVSESILKRVGASINYLLGRSSNHEGRILTNESYLAALNAAEKTVNYTEMDSRINYSAETAQSGIAGKNLIINNLTVGCKVEVVLQCVTTNVRQIATITNGTIIFLVVESFYDSPGAPHTAEYYENYNNPSMLMVDTGYGNITSFIPSYVKFHFFPSSSSVTINFKTSRGDVNEFHNYFVTVLR